jgi:hypothetical protein
MNQPMEQFFLEGLFQINKGVTLVFFTETKPPATPLPDLSKLPEEIVRQIATYLRTPSAEHIARQTFFRREIPVHGIIWKNLDGWLVFRQRQIHKRRKDLFYKKDYAFDARICWGHVNHQLWKESRERVPIYKYNCKNRMTPTKAWLRQQLAMNNIFPLSGQVGKRFGSCSWLWTDV